MSRNDKQDYLICYDIANPRRLGKIYRYLKKRAFHIQNSIFVANFNKQELDEVLSSLGSLINSKEDDVRIYDIPKDTEITTFGMNSYSDILINITENIGKLTKNDV